jgi:hypothetical protein
MRGFQASINNPHRGKSGILFFQNFFFFLFILNQMSAMTWKHSDPYNMCAADFSLLNLPKGKSLGRSKPATNS